MKTRIDAARIEPGQLMGAEVFESIPGQMRFQVSPQLGSGHALDVRGVAKPLLVPSLAAALVLLAAAAGAGLVAADALEPAVAQLRAHFDGGDVDVYMASLLALDSDVWGELGEVPQGAGSLARTIQQFDQRFARSLLAAIPASLGRRGGPGSGGHRAAWRLVAAERAVDRPVGRTAGSASWAGTTPRSPGRE